MVWLELIAYIAIGTVLSAGATKWLLNQPGENPDDIVVGLVFALGVVAWPIVLVLVLASLGLSKIGKELLKRK